MQEESKKKPCSWRFGASQEYAPNAKEGGIDLPSRDRPASDDCRAAASVALQAAKGEIDGFELTELAGPAALGRLAGGTQRVPRSFAKRAIPDSGTVPSLARSRQARQREHKGQRRLHGLHQLVVRRYQLVGFTLREGHIRAVIHGLLEPLGDLKRARQQGDGRDERRKLTQELPEENVGVAGLDLARSFEDHQDIAHLGGKDIGAISSWIP